MGLKEKHRLRVFEYRELRKIFGRKRNEVTGEWRRLHDGGTLRSVQLAKYYTDYQIKK
jgi:hypothetical protein